MSKIRFEIAMEFSANIFDLIREYTFLSCQKQDLAVFEISQLSFATSASSFCLSAIISRPLATLFIGLINSSEIDSTNLQEVKQLGIWPITSTKPTKSLLWINANGGKNLWFNHLVSCSLGDWLIGSIGKKESTL